VSKSVSQANEGTKLTETLVPHRDQRAPFHSGRERTRACRRLAVGVALDASDVGGQDVDAVAVQMPRARS